MLSSSRGPRCALPLLLTIASCTPPSRPLPDASPARVALVPPPVASAPPRTASCMAMPPRAPPRAAVDFSDGAHDYRGGVVGHSSAWHLVRHGSAVEGAFVLDDAAGSSSG